MKKTSMYVVFMHDPQSKNYEKGSRMPKVAFGLKMKLKDILAGY